MFPSKFINQFQEWEKIGDNLLKKDPLVTSREVWKEYEKYCQVNQKEIISYQEMIEWCQIDDIQNALLEVNEKSTTQQILDSLKRKYDLKSYNRFWIDRFFSLKDSHLLYKEFFYRQLGRSTNVILFAIHFLMKQKPVLILCGNYNNSSRLKKLFYTLSGFSPNENHNIEFCGDKFSSFEDFDNSMRGKKDNTVMLGDNLFRKYEPVAFYPKANRYRILFR